MTARIVGPCEYPDSDRCGEVTTYANGCRGDACFERKRILSADTRPPGRGGIRAAGDWIDEAKCRNATKAVADLFFSDDLDDQRSAKAICDTCPVQPECLEHAIAAREIVGIWGGRNASQRRKIARDRRRLRGSGDMPASLTA